MGEKSLTVHLTSRHRTSNITPVYNHTATYHQSF